MEITVLIQDLKIFNKIWSSLPALNDLLKDKNGEKVIEFNKNGEH